MRPPQSLHGRLALWLGLGITLLSLFAAVVAVAQLRHEMNEVYDSAMQEAAQRLLPLAVRDILDRDAHDLPEQRISTLRQRDEYFSYVVRDAGGQVLIRSHHANPADFPPFSAVGFSDTPTARTYSDAALQGTITISIAEPLARRREAVREVAIGLATPLAMILPLSLLTIWLVVRWSLTPLRRLRAGIEARGAGDLTPIADSGLPAELMPVAGAVNHLLHRLDQALAAERSFTANSAHELRTPVAAALAQAQRLELEATDHATRERARSIAMALGRLSRLSEKLMQLARAEGGGMEAGGMTELGAILRLVVHDLDTGDGRLDVTMPEPPVPAWIDADAFAILARNLIENALKHGPAGQPVEVGLTADRALRVRNGGPPVAPDLLATLSRPFTRGQTLADGSGLGLAIARAIAGRSGGRLELASPVPGRDEGFEAVFHAPDHG